MDLWWARDDFMGGPKQFGYRVDHHLVESVQAEKATAVKEWGGPNSCSARARRRLASRRAGRSTSRVERLKEMGLWLQKHGGAIYGTRGGPWKPTKTLASTRRDHTIYLHVLENTTGKVELTALPVPIVSAALTDGTPVTVKRGNGVVELSFDPAKLDPIDTIARIQVRSDALAIPAVDATTWAGAPCRLLGDERRHELADQVHGPATPGGTNLEVYGMNASGAAPCR